MSRKETGPEEKINSKGDAVSDGSKVTVEAEMTAPLSIADAYWVRREALERSLPGAA